MIGVTNDEMVFIGSHGDNNQHGKRKRGYIQ